MVVSTTPGSPIVTSLPFSGATLGQDSFFMSQLVSGLPPRLTNRESAY